MNRNRKRKIKRNLKKIVLVFIFFLGIGWIIKNKYYDFKLEKIIEEIVPFGEIDYLQKEVGISDLEALANKNSKIKKIMENKESYPEVLLEMLSRNLDMLDYVDDYLDNKGQVFDNTIGNVTKGEYPLLLQYDKKWGYGIYGDEVMAINGCGPTSMAIIIAGLTGRNDITPYDIANYAFNNGYYQGGTSWSFFVKGIKKYGVIGTELPLSKSRMMAELESGHPIICSMGKGYFTTTGHLITIVGVKNGEFIVKDPNSKERSSKLWSYEKIANQIRNIWSFQVA